MREEITKGNLIISRNNNKKLKTLGINGKARDKVGAELVYGEYCFVVMINGHT